MFTYRENRVLFVEEGRETGLVFPGRVDVTVEFSPESVLGSDVPGPCVRLGSQARVRWNANTGRVSAHGDPPLPPPAISEPISGMMLRLDGTTVHATWDCNSREELVGTLGALHFVLPVSLAIEFGAAVTVASTSGKLGDATFVWQVERTEGKFDVMEPSDRDARCVVALRRLPTLCNPSHSRLLAGAAYLQRAMRLLVVGDGPSEFAGEAVINFAKMLEVMFPGPPERSRDAVRVGLAALGIESQAIEATFIPALILRSRLDAAHVRMASLTASERRQLQSYMESVEPEFRRLLVGAADRAATGAIEIAPYKADERSLGDELARTLNALDRNV